MVEPPDPISYPISEALRKEHMDESKISQYILRYLSSFGVKSFIKERKYIDKDYIIDYSKFYARSFEQYERFTERIHFFSADISTDEINALITGSDGAILTKLKDNYLGFTIIKPIKNKYGQKLIGRTVLKPYDREVIENPAEERVILKPPNSANLYGIHFDIPSLPFQTQDIAVGACATTACWIAINSLADTFEVAKLSPIEITEKSVTFPAEGRNFPSKGLTYFQIKNYFNSIGLDTEFIIPSKILNYKYYNKKTDDIITDIVKSYIREINLPIIAGLKILREKGLTPLYHAAIISGYRHENGKVNKLYVHDDQIGPYSRVIPQMNFFSWRNEWLNRRDIRQILIDKLIIPIYPKIRLTFRAIYPLYLGKYKDKLDQKIREEGINPRSKYELFLTDVRKYKKFLFQQPIEDKINKLKRPFPRFLWIVRLECDRLIYYDYIFDGTSVFAKDPYESIVYRYT